MGSDHSKFKMILYDDVRNMSFVEFTLRHGLNEDTYGYNVSLGMNIPDPIPSIFEGSYEDCLTSVCKCSGTDCSIKESGGNLIDQTDYIDLTNVHEMQEFVQVIQTKTRQHLCKEICELAVKNEIVSGITYERNSGHCEESLRVTEPSVCEYAANALGKNTWLTDGKLTVDMNSDMPSGCTFTDASNAFLNIGSEATECSDAHPCLCSNQRPVIVVENNIESLKNGYENILCN